jgi:thiol-disulfide isomerase/thioredoxin
MGILKYTFFLLISLNLMATTLEKEQFENLKTIHQTNDLASNQKLLYFWASWCPNCKESMKTKLVDLKNEQVDVVTVNVDEDVKRAHHYIEEEKVQFPVIRDEEKKLRQVLKIFAVPSWAVLKKENNQWVVKASQVGNDFKEIKKSLALP